MRHKLAFHNNRRVVTQGAPSIPGLGIEPPTAVLNVCGWLSPESA